MMWTPKVGKQCPNLEQEPNRAVNLWDVCLSGLKVSILSVEALVVLVLQVLGSPTASKLPCKIPQYHRIETHTASYGGGLGEICGGGVPEGGKHRVRVLEGASSLPFRPGIPIWLN